MDGVEMTPLSKAKNGYNSVSIILLSPIVPYSLNIQEAYIHSRQFL